MQESKWCGCSGSVCDSRAAARPPNYRAGEFLWRAVWCLSRVRVCLIPDFDCYGGREMAAEKVGLSGLLMKK